MYVICNFTGAITEHSDLKDAMRTRITSASNTAAILNNRTVKITDALHNNGNGASASNITAILCSICDVTSALHDPILA